MLENLPVYISLTFGLTTIATLLLFSRVIKTATSETTQGFVNKINFGLLVWLILQAVLTLTDVYNFDTDLFPPTLLLYGILSPVLTIIALFSLNAGRQFIDSLSLRAITYLHIVRVPVEIVLYWLFLAKAVPELMTFAGRNFDIVAGVTAPMIAYFGFVKARIGRRTILLWNFIGLGLLLNIVINAFFSAPSPVQKFAFEQPNIAILHFPFSWLPTFVVPIVLFAHLISIRQLLRHSRCPSSPKRFNST